LNQLKEQENLIFELEDRQAKNDDMLVLVHQTLAELKGKNDDLSLRVGKSIDVANDVKMKIDSIMGDSTSIQGFVAAASKDITTVKRKVSKLDGLHTNLVGDSDTRMTTIEKLLSSVEKRAMWNTQEICTLKHDMTLHKKLKQTQYKVIVTEIDNLMDFKLQFNKRLDFLNSKTDTLTTICNKTVEELIKKFESVKQPMMNKVEDLKGISDLYRAEIERTQRTNREMLYNYGRIRSDISEARRETLEQLTRIS